MPWGAPIPATDPSLEAQLERCVDDLDRCLAEAIHRFGNGALGSIHLPMIRPELGLSAGELLAVSALWWCRCVEAAGLPRLVERLAEAAFEGSLELPLGPEGAALLASYHHERRDRHSFEERRYRYSLLFGGPGCPYPNALFREAFDALIDAVSDQALQTGSGPRAHRAQIGASAQALLRALSGRASGATRFDADRVLLHIREALAMLRHPEVAAALGGGGVFTLLRRWAPPLLGEDIDPAPHIERARAGAVLLRGLSKHLDAVAEGWVELPPQDPSLDAALQLRSLR